MSLLIKNGTVVDPVKGCLLKRDIRIEEGKIVAMEDAIAPTVGEETIDASGKYIGPGLVDVHVHFRDPGFTYKEDIYTGAKAAAAGGVTTVVLMANTKPAVDNPETLSYVLTKGKETDIHVETCCNVTKGLAGKELVDLQALSELGAAGFTDDGIPIMDAALLKKAMVLAKQIGKPISLHEEDPSLISNNGVNSHIAQTHFGIGGSPREAEISLIKRDLEIALETGACLDVQHISTKEGVALVREAKALGGDVHAEACPHHFTLTEDAVVAHGTLAKMNPPLRLEEDRLAIIKGLQDGTIDLIATDHAPHAKEEKDKPLTEAPSGIIGLETVLPLSLTSLVKPGYLTLPELFAKVSLNPARMYGLDAGYIAVDGPADLVLFDMEQTVVGNTFASKSCNTPFIGMPVDGSVCLTICDGKVIYKKEA